MKSIPFVLLVSTLLIHMSKPETKDGKKYEILEGENRKLLKLDKTKVGRKKGTINQKKKG